MSEATEAKTETSNVVSIAKPERERTVWDDETIDLIKKQVCPAGIPDGEFKLFVMKCRQTGMNPLIGEAFCVPRNVKLPTGSYVTQFVFQPAEQGMETRADRFDDFEGLRAAVVREKDTITINADEGTVKHSFSPVGDRGAIIGAWAIAYRRGRKTPVEFVRFDEYVQMYQGKPSGQWGTKPETMIVKCARAAALRRAYPQAFAGIYVKEEIEVDGETTERDPGAPPPPSKLNPTSRTDEVLGKVREQVAQARSTPPQPSPSQATVDAPKSTPTPPEEMVVGFGPSKNKPIAGLTAEELSDAITLGDGNLLAQPKANWAPKVREVVAALKAEQEKRMAELSGEAPF